MKKIYVIFFIIIIPWEGLLFLTKTSFLKERTQVEQKEVPWERAGALFPERLAVDSFLALAVSSRHITVEGWLSGR